MNDTVKLLIEAGKSILPAIVPGAGAAMLIGKGIVDALEAAKDLGTPGDQSENAETRKAVRAKILEHFDDTISGLRGED